jgi:Flavin-binding monooxygenase-like
LLFVLPGWCTKDTVKQSKRRWKLFESNTDPKLCPTLVSWRRYGHWNSVKETLLRLSLAWMKEKENTYEVAIIGSGPAGLVAAKSLLDKEISNIVVLEETSCAGGLWNREGAQGSKSNNARISVPCLIRNEITGEIVREIPSSCQPVYDNLRSNFPKDLTSFIGHSFPSHVEHFPDAATVASYYQGYGKRFGVDKLTRYHTRVEHCVKDDSLGKWKIQTKHFPSGGENIVHSKRILVCNGHFRKAYAPCIQGMQNFRGGVLRSSAFTSPRDFLNKTILIVGGGISGADIASILLKFRISSRKNYSVHSSVIVSVRDWKTPQDILLPRLQRKFGLVVCPGINRIDTDGYVHFACSTGSKKYTSLPELYTVRPDVILFATGYRYHFPFFDDTSRFMRGDGFKLEALYKRVLSLSDRSLAFIGITNINFSPALVMEYQARWYSKMVVKDECHALVEEDMKKEVESRKHDNTQDALALKFPSYCNSLAADIGVPGYWRQILGYRLSLYIKSCWARKNLSASRIFIILTGFVVVPIIGTCTRIAIGPKRR